MDPRLRLCGRWQKSTRTSSPSSVWVRDASDLRSIRRATQRVGAALPPGGLNLLINNAAVLPRGGLQTTSPEDMQSALHTNVLGPANIIKEFLPLLRAAVRAGGRAGMSCRQAAVVNISAFLGSFPSIEETYDFLPAISYRMSKAALNMLTLCASTELKRDGILVAALHPGWVRTDMGTQEADIDARESVEGMLDVVFSLNEKDTGTFLNYKGKVIGW
ncbi:C-factor-like isoform X2 [Betta splendens]|uniref:C-factor-like isoform X2 n=1 Tax=Betta splendens TaxID=158456 RepID=A0A6P7NCX2_BETSP|nr:C-factor-like isoform X2 [Betta splendens]